LSACGTGGARGKESATTATFAAAIDTREGEGVHAEVDRGGSGGAEADSLHLCISRRRSMRQRRRPYPVDASSVCAAAAAA
jgi:hypothetical protein